MYLGIDIGTQSVKALMYDAERHRVAGVYSAPLEMLSDNAGKREQLAEWWLDALGKVLHQFSADDRAKVQAIAVSGQQHGFVPLGVNGEVLAIEVGFVLVLLSFIPHTLASAGLPEEQAWPTASAIAVAVTASMTVRRVIQLRRHAGGVISFGRVFALPLTLFSLALNTANVFVWQAAGPYVIALVSGLVVASGMFLLLLFRFFPLEGDG